MVMWGRRGQVHVRVTFDLSNSTHQLGLDWGGVAWVHWRWWRRGQGYSRVVSPSEGGGANMRGAGEGPVVLDHLDGEVIELTGQSRSQLSQHLLNKKLIRWPEGYQMQWKMYGNTHTHKEKSTGFIHNIHFFSTHLPVHLHLVSL